MTRNTPRRNSQASRGNLVQSLVGDAGQPHHGAFSSDIKQIRVRYDLDAGVWWAESDDLPGLVSEAPTLDALVERVAAVVPELLAANAALRQAGLPKAF